MSRIAQSPSGEDAPTGADSALQDLQHENAELVERLRRTHIALERATFENAELRRSLAQMNLQNRALGATMRPSSSAADRTDWIRTMLRDRRSRNP